MAGMRDFSESDWQSILDEVRLLVIASGFAQWDEAMMASLEEAEERPGAHDVLIYYGRTFTAFLKIRSAENVAGLSERLGRLVRREDGEPVTGVVFEDGSDGRYELLASSDEPNGLIVELSRIFSAIADSRDDFFSDPDDGLEEK